MTMKITKQVKICDNCDKEIDFSEFCLFHFKKARHFCNKKCFFNFINKYVELNDEEVKDETSKYKLNDDEVKDEISK